MGRFGVDEKNPQREERSLTRPKGSPKVKGPFSGLRSARPEGFDWLVVRIQHVITTELSPASFWIMRVRHSERDSVWFSREQLSYRGGGFREPRCLERVGPLDEAPRTHAWCPL